MRAGAAVIFQATLRDGRWAGRPDVLRRVETLSALGPWSYEVVDTKLAKETRGGTVLQLALSDLLRVSQGAPPERFQVVTPDPASPVQIFRVQDFAAYFRLGRSRLTAAAHEDPDAIAAANYPEPVEHCDVCRWWSTCDRRRRDDDHLSLVAGISRLQTRELQSAGVATLAQLGELALPLPFAPRRGAADTYVRVREQARLQLLGRTHGRPVHELLPVTPDHGLARLPAPSPGDVFLDLEGDPFARDGGREYLFGLVVVAADGSATYHARWAHSDAEERAAFEAVVDLILGSWAADPGMQCLVDEAGQMSLANVLAVSHAANSVVLLGDPQQLEQPQQGSHPEGTDVSALEHILRGHQTIPPDRGIFLPETWRLAPSLCAFTSEVFYEGRLRSPSRRKPADQERRGLLPGRARPVGGSAASAMEARSTEPARPRRQSRSA
jgi:hypothetical protein